MVDRSYQSFWEKNRLEVMERLRPTIEAADGVLYHTPNSMQKTLVYKKEHILYLYFNTDHSDEVQSRVDLRDPLFLLSPYSQLAMVGFLIPPKLENIYIIGLGGARIPICLHHMLARSRIECAEIDPDVIKVAQEYFGLKTDERLHVVHCDGRQWLSEQPAGKRYDLIMVDAFLGTGAGPRALATAEFYTSCLSRLAEGGVVLVNLLPSDPEFAIKHATVLASFPHVYHLIDFKRGNQLFFGCSATHAPSIAQIVERAHAWAEAYDFGFPLAEQAAQLSYQYGQQVLSTSTVPLLHDTGAIQHVKLGRNDACFCGSGKKFKKCHGA